MSDTPTAGKLAEVVGGTLRGDADLVLTGVAPLDGAGPQQLSFLAQASYRGLAEKGEAGCVLVGDESLLPGRTVIVTKDPYRAFALAMAWFHPSEQHEPGVSPQACVAASATVAASAHVAAGVSVGAGAVVGERSVLLAGAVVGANVSIGEDCIIHPNVVFYPGTHVGDRVAVHANAVLGSDGFGYSSGVDGHVKIPHAGRVVVEDDVEIGAGSCVDRAVMGETRIGAGSKIDNLVQVAHNVQIGPGSLLVAQSGVSGSTVLGKGCVLAGQSGVAGHLTMGDGARVGAKSAVYEDVEAGETVTGIPAVKHGSWRRIAAALNRLPGLVKRVRRLEQERSTDAAENKEESR